MVLKYWRTRRNRRLLQHFQLFTGSGIAPLCAMFDRNFTPCIRQSHKSSFSEKFAKNFDELSIRRSQRHIIRPIRNQFVPKRLLNLPVIHQKRARHSLNVARRWSTEISVRPREQHPQNAFRIQILPPFPAKQSERLIQRAFRIGEPRNIQQPIRLSFRFFAIVSTASRQNVQPKCRKNTSSRGRAASSAKVCPSCER